MSPRAKGVGAVARIAAAASIGDVRLMEATVKRRIRHATEVGDKALVTIGHGARLGGVPSTDGSFFVVAGVEAKVAPQDSKAAPFIVVKVSFEVSYRLPEGFTATKAELAEFAQTNGVFNAWPYCREFIQNATVRMGLPPIVLPLYRVKAYASEGKKARRESRAGGADSPDLSAD